MTFSISLQEKGRYHIVGRITYLLMWHDWPARLSKVFASIILKYRGPPLACFASNGGKNLCFFLPYIHLVSLSLVGILVSLR